MQAIILAAGRGSRAGQVTQERPKSFLELGGRKIIEHQIHALRQQGVEKIVVVVGYQAPLFYQELGQYNLQFVMNPFYAQCNVLGSLWFAREKMTEDFLFLHADTFFEPSIVGDLIRAPQEMVFAVEKKNTVEEEMKVKIRNGVIYEINKTMSCAEAYGEFIGVAKVAGASVTKVRAAVENRIERLGDLNSYFEAAVQDLIDVSTPVHHIDINPRFSVEIDFPEDYARAQSWLNIHETTL